MKNLTKVTGIFPGIMSDLWCRVSGMDNKEEIIAETQRLISKWYSGYMPVTSVTDEIHNHIDWSINDTDDLVFLATMMILMLESENK